jgi:hypothetical protein
MRVTLDYDGTGFRSKYLTVFSWFVLKILSRGAQYGRKSADSGYHLKCHGLRISFKLSLLIRFLLLEDGHRSLFDMQRLKKPKQILWTHKNKKPASKWTQSLLEVIR